MKCRLREKDRGRQMERKTGKYRGQNRAGKGKKEDYNSVEKLHR